MLSLSKHEDLQLRPTPCFDKLSMRGEWPCNTQTRTLMTHSPLLVRPQHPDPEGRVLSVTPQSAGWTYVGFELFDLPRRHDAGAADRGP